MPEEAVPEHEAVQPETCVQDGLAGAQLAVVHGEVDVAVASEHRARPQQNGQPHLRWAPRTAEPPSQN